MVELESSLQYVKGVGPKLAKNFEKLGLRNVEDCFSFFPREFDDRRRLPKIIECKPQTQVTLVATILSVSEKIVKKKISIIECCLQDVTGQIQAVWFNQPYLKRMFAPQKQIIVKGKIEQSLFIQKPQLNVTHTEMIYSQKEYNESVGIVMPVYGLTYGVHQLQIRRLIKTIFETSLKHIKEAFPLPLLTTLKLVTIHESLKQLHFPTSVELYKKARQRYVFDEFFYYQLRLEKKRLKHQEINKTEALQTAGPYIDTYLEQLEYDLTVAQKKVITEIKEDLAKKTAMNRLLQGDVGSGKTDVAIITMLCAIQSNKSAVLMVPTEILSVQHYLKIKRLLSDLEIDICLLKGKMRKKEKDASLLLIESEKPTIIIGTHALIEDKISIPNLGVVIVDEQHRFGVIQRSKLKNKGLYPHCLYMTATPIPRSFMLTCFGDLEKSIIDELPPGRVPAENNWVKQAELPHVYQSCFKKLNDGQQLYVVYPLVEESEKIDLKSAMEGYETIQKVYPEFTVGIIHGRMRPDEKNNIMQQFKEKKIMILVSTTVIEVGIDVPNATLMIIRHAERFGLSQLHQLRGRIGRGGNTSSCYFVSDSKTENAQKRLKSICSTNDGFKIAEYDLLIRGPGDVLGTRQSGLPDFKLANLVHDESILQLAKKTAQKILTEDPSLSSSQFQLIKKEFEKRQRLNPTDSLN